MQGKMLEDNREIEALKAKIQKEHPWTQNDYEMAVYNSELTNDEENIFIAYQVNELRKEFEFEDKKIHREICKDLDTGPYQWARRYFNEFHQIEEIEGHIQVIKEFHETRKIGLPGPIIRLLIFKKRLRNAYLNIREEEDQGRGKIKAYA